MTRKDGNIVEQLNGTGLVLICSGCYNKIQQTAWLMNNKNVFLTVLKGGCSRSRDSGESPLPK